MSSHLPFSKKRSCFFLILSLFLFFVFFFSFLLRSNLLVSQANGYETNQCNPLEWKAQQVHKECCRTRNEQNITRVGEQKTSLDPRHFAWKTYFSFFFFFSRKRRFTYEDRFNRNFLSLCPAKPSPPFSFDEWPLSLSMLQLQVQRIARAFQIVKNYWKSIGLLFLLFSKYLYDERNHFEKRRKIADTSNCRNFVKESRVTIYLVSFQSAKLLLSLTRVRFLRGE